MKIYVIGINDNNTQLSNSLKSIVYGNMNFAGGIRHHKLVSELLPLKYNWVNITTPLEKLFDEIKKCNENWVVFASGDPLFFGIANTLIRKFPNVDIEVFPGFNSLQMLAHRFKLPYGKFQTISLTGREWHEFDKALISGSKYIGLLTDKKKTLNEIAKRMNTFHYSNYKIYYGDNLGVANERTAVLSVKEAVEFKVCYPHCLFIEMINDKIPQKFIPEQNFLTLSGRPNMITKLPYRLTTLSFMELNCRKVFWDIGACTGSVSIEAKLNYPHLDISAFEIRQECKQIILQNSIRFQSPGIKVYIDDYLQVNKSNFTRPDAVFIGGHGGKLEDILNNVDRYLNTDGVIAMNAVKKDSIIRFEKWCNKNNYTITHNNLLTLDNYNSVNVLISKIK